LHCLPQPPPPSSKRSSARAGYEIRNAQIMEKKQVKDFLQLVPEITRKAERRKKMRKSD
jgi:hypothetical protein